MSYLKTPDYSINSATNGESRIGHLSPEGEYLVALVVHAAVYGRNPLNATNDISFNHRGWSGYSDKLFPETPYPDDSLISPAKAKYYQEVALEVVSEFYQWDAASLPARIDTDGDGVPDELDVFPNDPDETLDSDGDGVGDNADAFPNDASQSINLPPTAVQDDFSVLAR